MWALIRLPIAWRTGKSSEALVPLADVKVPFAYSALMFAALIIGHHFSISFL